MALELVSNALNSFSLLNEVGKRSGLNTWVVQTAAIFTPEQRHTNQVVFAGLHDALTPMHDESDVPSYLRHLAELDPSLLRQYVLESLHRRFSRHVSAAIPETTRLLDDVQTYLHCVQRVQGEARFDLALQTEVHRLLQDPSALQRFVLSHLELLWQTTFSIEWRRVQVPLSGQVEMFTCSLDGEATLGEIFHTFNIVDTFIIDWVGFFSFFIVLQHNRCFPHILSVLRIRGPA